MEETKPHLGGMGISGALGVADLPSATPSFSNQVLHAMPKPLHALYPVPCAQCRETTPGSQLRELSTCGGQAALMSRLRRCSMGKATNSSHQGQIGEHFVRGTVYADGEQV